MGGFTLKEIPFAEKIGNLGTSLIRESGVGEVFSTKPRAKYAAGARTIIRVNGKPLAFAFSVSWNIQTQQTPIRTIDDFLPYEYAPKFIEVTGKISGWHIPGEGPTALDIQQNILSFLFHRYITVEVRDRTTDALLFFASNAVIVSRSESINVDDLARMELEFKAIGWKDEKEPRTPALARGMQGAKDTATSTDTSLSQKAGNALNDAASAIRSVTKKLF